MTEWTSIPVKYLCFHVSTLGHIDFKKEKQYFSLNGNGNLKIKFEIGNWKLDWKKKKSKFEFYFLFLKKFKKDNQILVLLNIV